MEQMGLGAAIACSSAIFAIVFGIVAIIFKLIDSKKNPGRSNRDNSIEKRLNAVDKKFDNVRWKDSCEEIVKRIEGTHLLLKEAVELGFRNMGKQLDEIKRKLP